MKTMSKTQSKSKPQPFLYYELKPAVLLFGAFYILFSRNEFFLQMPLGFFCLGLSLTLIYRRLQYRGYLT
jgi:hypothetical protein